MALIRYNSADHDDRTQERDIYIFFSWLRRTKEIVGIERVNGRLKICTH